MLPDDLSQVIRGYQSSRIVLTGIELNLFTAIGPGATAEELSANLRTGRRATEMLANALTALGLLVKRDGTYRNSPDAARFLDDASPESERLALMHAVNQWDAWSTLTECVRAGTSITAREGPDHTPEWTEAFIAAMARNASERAPRVVRAVASTGACRLLDVGGGPGSYAIEFARANPELEAVVFDKPSVLPITARHIERAGLTDRIRTRPGDLKSDEFGSGYNIILLSNVCHMLSPEENLNLLARTYRALAPGGRVVIQDFILNEDRTGPLQAAMFSINMLVATPRGASYTESDYSGWLRGAGFTGTSRVELPGPSDLVIGTKSSTE